MPCKFLSFAFLLYFDFSTYNHGLKKKIFSYSRVDGAPFALRLALDLKKEQFDVWIDQDDIRAGSEWDIEIEKGLETCDYLLFIETAGSVKSENVLDEVYYALEQRKKVIPLIESNLLRRIIRRGFTEIFLY